MEKKRTILEIVKDNVLNLTTLITTLGIVFGGWFFIDERYAHAADFKEQQSAQVQAIQQLQTTQSAEIRLLQKDSNIRYRQLRIDSIDDKIFYLQQKPKMTEQDRALLDRYMRQREDEVRGLNAEMRGR